MSHKPNLSDFKMPIRDQILIKTIMEMTDKVNLIRCGLENCSWSEIISKPSEGQECPRYTLTGNEWAELMDLASTYVAAHPKLEWLSSSEHQYISEHGFRYTREEKEKYWKVIGTGASDYMSEWHKTNPSGQMITK